MDSRDHWQEVQQWSAIRKLSRRLLAQAPGRCMGTPGMEATVRRAHERLVSRTAPDYLPPLSGVENRLYILFAD